jgi:SAM-dependent methyltransferase
VYSFAGYGSMLTDRARVSAFREAICRVVTRDRTVLELGAGPGLFSIIAARLGAPKVYAIDPNPFVALARLAAERNGFADRVEVHQCLSTEWTPNGPVDVVIHDLRGALPFFRGNLRALTDVRTRVAPRAIWIPACDRVYAALVSCPTRRSELIDVWQSCDASIDADAYTATALNYCHKVRFQMDMIVSEAHLLTTLDYRRELPVDLKASTTWTITEATQADGVAAWFESTLADDVRYTSAPNNPSSTYSQSFFPFPRPLSLGPGDTLNWTLHAMDTGLDYLLWWNTEATLSTGKTLKMRQGSLDLPITVGVTDGA